MAPSGDRRPLRPERTRDVRHLWPGMDCAQSRRALQESNSSGCWCIYWTMTDLARDAAMGPSMIRMAAAGDADAFARIVAACHGDMTRVAFVVAGGDQDLADDAVQAAWSIAWRKLGSLRDPTRLRPWLVAVAANEARQACRRQRRRAVVEIDVVDREATSHLPADREGVLDLERALAHLGPEERALLALRYEAGLDSSEIGVLTGRPAATVRWRLARLIARLRKELADD